MATPRSCRTALELANRFRGQVVVRCWHCLPLPRRQRGRNRGGAGIPAAIVRPFASTRVAHRRSHPLQARDQERCRSVHLPCPLARRLGREVMPRAPRARGRGETPQRVALNDAGPRPGASRPSPAPMAALRASGAVTLEPGHGRDGRPRPSHHDDTEVRRRREAGDRPCGCACRPPGGAPRCTATSGRPTAPCPARTP